MRNDVVDGGFQFRTSHFYFLGVLTIGRDGRLEIGQGRSAVATNGNEGAERLEDEGGGDEEDVPNIEYFTLF